VFPSILTVSNPGVCVDHSKLGFWCIGSGSTAAQMSLFNRDYSWNLPVEHAAYYLLEAKIFAERATGVGEKTDLVLIRKQLQPIVIQSATFKILRDVHGELQRKTFDPQHQTRLTNTNEFKAFRFGWT
jgi:20S proteasome alpha/beta subunit